MSLFCNLTFVNNSFLIGIYSFIFKPIPIIYILESISLVIYLLLILNKLLL